MRCKSFFSILFSVCFIFPVFCEKYEDQEKLPPKEINLSDSRMELILNGIWKFRPEKSSSWGLIRVPGLWSNTHSWLGAALDGVKVFPADNAWDAKSLQKTDSGIYSKTFSVPETWKNREIFLEMDQVCGVADVSVNEKKIGRIMWPSGSLNLTKSLIPGKKVTLTLNVHAVPRVEFDQVFTYYTAERRKSVIYCKGIGGDVLLQALPEKIQIDSVFVKPSLKRKNVSVDVFLAKIPTGKAIFEIRILDAAGVCVKHKQFSRTVSAPDGKEKMESFSIPWENPKLWDYNQPELYRMRIKVVSGEHSDEFVQRFGFREFTVSGRDFLLNGKKFRIRPVLLDAIRIGSMSEMIRQFYEMTKNSGFNLIEYTTMNTFGTGNLFFDKELASAADEAGMPLIMPVPTFNPVVQNTVTMKEQEFQIWEKEFLKNWKRIRNNPSILVLICGFNNFGNQDGMNPMRIGNASRQQYPVNDSYRKRIASGERFMDAMRKADPTRPAMTHHSGPVGDIMSNDLYLNFIPLQEREEWLSEWAKSGDKPYMAVEFGCPYGMTLMRGRDCGPSFVFNTEPMLTEVCSTYIGPDAFRNEMNEYRRDVRKTWVKTRYYNSWHSVQSMIYNPVYQDLLQLFIRNTWRSWRAYGISGGMIPWCDAGGWEKPWPNQFAKVSPVSDPRRKGSVVDAYPRNSLERYDMKKANVVGKVLQEVNSDTLAYIGGKVPDFVDKTHHFRNGEIVHKQIVMLNDTRKEEKGYFIWEAFVGTKKIASGEISRTLIPGTTEFVPFQFSLPPIVNKTEGEIRIEGTIGNRKHSDRFTFRIYPSVNRQGEKLYVYDSQGTTESFLKKAGFHIESIRQIPVKMDSVLVVGERSFGGKDFPLKELEQYVRIGGRVLILTHEPDFFRDFFAFRIGRHLARRAFRVESMKHLPFLQTLHEEELRDWRGSSTLFPAQMWTELDTSVSGLRTPVYGYHWGNRGTVSSAPIEKPHVSGWTPLLETEYALAYSPLMQCFFGKGMVMLCSLDIVSRSDSDPAAEHLLQGILSHLKQSEIIPRKEVVIDATGDSLELLKKMRLKGKEGIPKENSILMIGSNSKFEQAKILEYINKGGIVMFMPRKAGDRIPGFRIENRTIGKITEIPAWNAARGISLSDLYLKADYTGPVLVSDAANAEIAANGLLGRYPYGKGCLYAVQLLPGMLNAEKYDYYHFTEWRFLRTFSQILANLGAEFGSDDLFFQRQRESSVPKELKLPMTWKGLFEYQTPRSATKLKDPGNKGVQQGWHKPDFDDSAWHPIKVGMLFQGQSDYFKECNGAVWYRIKFHLPAEFKGKVFVLDLGQTDDVDIAYLNGYKVGETTTYAQKSIYHLNHWTLRYGEENTLAVRVFDWSGHGGIAGSPVIREVIPPKKTSYFHLYQDNYNDREDGDDVFRHRGW